jgi:putative MATE family efflux protein
MTRAEAATRTETSPVPEITPSVHPGDALSSRDRLLWQLVALSLPIVFENLLNMFVGLTDTFLAGHLKQQTNAATAAVGTITYVLWLISLIAGAIGTGSTAIIARAVGARHRSLANSVCGQSIAAAALAGIMLAAVFFSFSQPLADLTGLSGEARTDALFYIKVLSLSLPFNMVMIAGASCLRGAGDTLSPAAAMIVVDGVNMLLSAGLSRGLWGLPQLGFRGIALGTVVAYTVGGVIVSIALFRGGWNGRCPLRLRVHRLRPHWLTLKRVLRIGLPSGLENLLTFSAQFTILYLINYLDKTNLMGSAHVVTIRVESLSYMASLAIATAAATLVGQSLGRRDPARATRATYIAFGLAAAVMAFWGVVFVCFGSELAGVLTTRPDAAALAGRCLFITAFAQIGFAALLVFGGALRGAGDTLVVMVINLASTIGLRLTAVLIVTLIFHKGLDAIWIVLSCELTIRGLLVYLRFRQGGWRHVKV